MKRITSIIVGTVCLVMAVVLISCHTKQADQTQYRDKIIGKWKCTYERQVSRSGVESENNDVGYVREFKSDGTFRDVFPSGNSHEATWSLEKDGITLYYPAATPPWIFRGIITEITDTSLELKLQMTQEGKEGYLNITERYERM